MVAKVWRERVAYAAMSLFVVWHTIAMVVAPAPGTSDLIEGLRTVLDPYLYFFKLDNECNFVAPDIDEEGRDPPGVILRYVIKDQSGTLLVRHDHGASEQYTIGWPQTEVCCRLF